MKMVRVLFNPSNSATWFHITMSFCDYDSHQIIKEKNHWVPPNVEIIVTISAGYPSHLVII